MPVLLYGSECWCLRKEDERRLLVTEMSWLRRILGKSKRERVRSEKPEHRGVKETVIDKGKEDSRSSVMQPGWTTEDCQLWPYMIMWREREAEGDNQKPGWTT